jgi:hypothetical protein
MTKNIGWYGSKGRINRKAFLLVEIITIALGSLGFLAAYQIDGCVGQERNMNVKMMPSFMLG